MQKVIKIFMTLILLLSLGSFLIACGDKKPNEEEQKPSQEPEHQHVYVDGKCECGEKDPSVPEIPVISVFDFKETAYEIELEERVTVELNIDEAADKAKIVYTSANPEVATFVSGILKGVSVGETTISISYKDEANDLTKTITVKVTLTEAEQAFYDEAKAYDAKVEALSNFTSSDVEALKVLVEELDVLSIDVLKYVTKGDIAIEMYNKARALVIDEMIEAIPDVVEVSHEAQIKAAREAYKQAETNVRKHVEKHEELKAKEDALAKAIYDATPDAVKLTYQEESYMKVNGNLVILADTAKKDPNTVLVWESSDPSVATVVDGVVTGIKPGNAHISATIQGTEYAMSLGITVLPETISEGLQFILDSHNTEAFTKRRLPIGSGTPNYYYNVMGSVSDILFSNLRINEMFLENGNKSGDYYLRDYYKASVEFITVHYTANFTSGAYNNANYFASGDGDVSIHYVTGNDGVYHCLDDKLYGAWHAGDSSSREYSNSNEYTDDGEHKVFSWIPTGVKYDGCELLDIEWSVSDDFYYEINGKKTSVKLPETYDYKSRTTNHIYNADGTISSAPGFSEQFSGREPESFFNDQNFPVKVVGDEYYMGSTWWCYTQVYEGRICSSGGNTDSIGIESCVDKNSNLWYTWHLTAQLVAKLMEENNLGIERVKGHHFFSGKDCPQPLLENDQEIWYEFIEMVEAEYKRRTVFADYEFTLTTDDSTYLHKNGYIKKWGESAQSLGYTVTITNGSETETITLYTLIPAK